jgi:aspartyl-tRNA(Asn)/glutamyl-tRNA(Gln) amidotransferase subunit C
MKLTEKEVRYVADLSNLALTDEEIARMVLELDEILTHVEKLNELDTTDVAPMTQVLFESEDTATLRDDLERPSLGTELALANAAVKGAGHFKIPLVIER